MPRTKPTEARDKILEAERIRLLGLQQDPAFQQDLENLKKLAERLEPSGLVSVADLHKMSEADLLPTEDEEAFHDIAERFAEKWGFQPRWTNDGGVELFTRSPVALKISLSTGKVIGVKRRYEHHPHREVDALEKHYLQLREQVHAKKGRTAPKQRKRLDTATLKLRARELRTQGKTVQQIAKILFPREYRDALKRDPSAEKRLRPLASKYMDPPHNLAWADAEKRAASELGIDLRPLSVKLHKLTERVRYLLKFLLQK